LASPAFRCKVEADYQFETFGATAARSKSSVTSGPPG